MEMSWVIAVLLAALASFISNLGVTLQKLHHLRNAADPRGPSDDYHRGWMWRVGLGLVFFGSLADFAALSFGPQSLVAPLGSLTLVSNVIFAPLLLKETIGHWDVLSTALIVIGSSVAVMFGSHEAVTYTVFELFSFFSRWEFVLYAICTSSYALMLYLFIQKIETIEREDGVHSPRYLHYKALHRFAYPSLSGTVGAQSVLFAKCVVELISNTVRHFTQARLTESDLPTGTTATSLNSNGTSVASTFDAEVAESLSQNMFVHWQTYFVFAAMIGSIFAQIKYLNDGLKRFDASYSVPVFTSFWIILSVLSGMIFYREYNGMTSAQCMFFALGVAITVTGVVLLGGREQSHRDHQPLTMEDGDEESPPAHDAPHAMDIASEDGGLHHPSEDHLDPPSMAGPDSDSRRGSIRHDAIEMSSLDGSGGSSSTAHVHHVSVTPHGGSHGPSSGRHLYLDEEEGTLADGAKTAVLEASQRISEAFNKLRGGDTHATGSGTSSASSSAPRSRCDSTATHDHQSSDESAEPAGTHHRWSMDSERDSNPLLKASSKTPRKSPSQTSVVAGAFTQAQTRRPSLLHADSINASTSNTSTTPATGSLSMPSTPFASLDVGVGPPPATSRRASLTPTTDSISFSGGGASSSSSAFTQDDSASAAAMAAARKRTESDTRNRKTHRG